MNINEFKFKVEDYRRNPPLTKEEREVFMRQSHDVLKPLTDERSKNLKPAYGLIDSVILVEELSELIQAVLARDEWATLEELSDVWLCLITQAYIHKIKENEMEMSAEPKLGFVDISNDKDLIKVVSELARCQQVISKDIRGKCSRDDYLSAYCGIVECVNALKCSLPFDESAFQAATKVKLERIINRLKENDIK